VSATDGSRERTAIDLGQAQIDETDIRLEARDQCQCVATGGCRFAVVTEERDELRDCMHGVGVVVDDEETATPTTIARPEVVQLSTVPPHHHNVAMDSSRQ